MSLTATILPLPLLKRNGDSLLRAVHVTVAAAPVQEGTRCILETRQGDAAQRFDLGMLEEVGENEFSVLLPEPFEEVTLEALLLYGDERWSWTVQLRPARRWTVHLVLHSHTDLGFTHPLSTVTHIHNENTDRAIHLCQETASWPEGTRFKWTCEVSWQVQQYIAARHPGQVETLMQWIRDGSIAVGALYAGELTDILGHEEAVRSFYYAAHLRRRYDIPCDTALLCDVPGCTKGFIQMMAKAGVGSFIIADNNFVAPFLARTDLPRPFWWKAPDNTRVLCWYTDHPFYAYIEGEYYGLTKDARTVARKLPEKLAALEAGGYPFDRLQLQYAFDNASIDERPLEVVREWNSTWEFPKIVLSTAREFMSHLHAAHPGQIPERTGDWTNWWAGIVTGFPVETSLSRSGHERAPAAELFWTGALLHETSLDYPEADIRNAYDGLLAFDEHSGGGAVWNPRSKEEQQQAIREGYGLIHNAVTALERLESGVAMALGKLIRNESGERAFALLNPTGLTRNGIARIPAPQRSQVLNVVDITTGQAMRTGRARDGTLQFQAMDVPPYGYRVYQLVPAAPGAARKTGNAKGEVTDRSVILENGLYRLAIDRETGFCSSLYSFAARQECLQSGTLLTQPLVYVSHPVTKIELGKYIPEIYTGVANPGEFLPWPSRSRAEFEYNEDPLLGAWCKVTHRINEMAWLTQEYRLPHEEPGLFISNVLHREARNNSEVADALKDFLGNDGLLYFLFPFEIPAGQFEYESPGAILRPSVEQFKGSCHDFFAVQRWCRVANAGLSIALVSRDAPLVDVGSVGLLRFKPGLDQDQSRLYVRAVALQEWGKSNESPYTRDSDLEFRFGIHVTAPAQGETVNDHAAREEAHAFGANMHAPFMSFLVPPNPRGMLPSAHHSWCSIMPGYVELMSMKESEDRTGVIVRVREALGEPAAAQVSFPGFRIASAWNTMITEERLEQAEVIESVLHARLSPFAIRTFLVVLERDEEGIQE